MKISENYNIIHKKEVLDKLCEFMDENQVTVRDFLACVCANIENYPQDIFRTVLKFGNSKFDICIKKEKI